MKARIQIDNYAAGYYQKMKLNSLIFVFCLEDSILKVYYSRRTQHL